MVDSLDDYVGVAVSDGTFFLDGFGWDVRASFVFDVDDDWFLVALSYLILMTSGEHFERECSISVTVTRAFTKYHDDKECFRMSVIASQDSDWRSTLNQKHVVCGELRDAASSRLVV